MKDFIQVKSLTVAKNAKKVFHGEIHLNVMKKHMNLLHKSGRGSALSITLTTTKKLSLKSEAFFSIWATVGMCRVITRPEFDPTRSK